MITFEDEVAIKLLQLKIYQYPHYYFKVKESISNINKCIDNEFKHHLKPVRFVKLLIELLRSSNYFLQMIGLFKFSDFKIDEYKKN